MNETGLADRLPCFILSAPVTEKDEPALKEPPADFRVSSPERGRRAFLRPPRGSSARPALSRPACRYKDRAFEGSLEEYVARLKQSTTVYVGNLAFHTTEEQIHELFSKCGLLRRIVMGLDKNARTPCGFCFVEYHTRSDTESCVRYLNGVLLDERNVRIDFDWCAPHCARAAACVGAASSARAAHCRPHATMRVG